MLGFVDFAAYVGYPEGEVQFGWGARGSRAERATVSRCRPHAPDLGNASAGKYHASMFFSRWQYASGFFV